MCLIFILFAIDTISFSQCDKVEISIQQLSDDVKEMKKIITSQALFLNRNTNNLNDFSQISNNKIEHGP